MVINIIFEQFLFTVIIIPIPIIYLGMINYVIALLSHQSREPCSCQNLKYIIIQYTSTSKYNVIHNIIQPYLF